MSRPAAACLTVYRGVRLSLGLLTVLPVGAVGTDPSAVRAAMIAAPAVGLTLGALAWAAGELIMDAGGGALVAAVSSVTVLALSTRGLHLDGLADLADGLGSARPAHEALAIMRKSDVGPFGVVTLVLVLLMQVAVLTKAWDSTVAGPVLLLACLTGRIALLWGCRAGVPAAHADGLGALVAGVVPGSIVLMVTGVACTGAAVWAAVSGGGRATAFSASVLVGLGAALLLQRRAVRRLGGITGDVLGGLVEAATTATALSLLLLA